MKQKLFSTIEGRIFLTGLMLSLLLLITIRYFMSIDIGTAKTLTLTFFSHTFGLYHESGF